jgi:hypothetical protein
MAAQVSHPSALTDKRNAFRGAPSLKSRIVDADQAGSLAFLINFEKSETMFGGHCLPHLLNGHYSLPEGTLRYVVVLGECAGMLHRAISKNLLA